MPEGFAGDGKLTGEAQPDAPAADPGGEPDFGPVLEFDIAAADLPRLLRAPVVLAHRQGRIRTAKLHTVWHDTASHTLQAHGLALAEQGGRWRLERLVPNGAADWLPAAPAPVLAEAPSQDALQARLPEKLAGKIAGRLVPVAAFTGTRRSLPLSGAGTRLEIVQGALRGVANDEPACRVILAGGGAEMAEFAHELAGQARLGVPRAGLAACAVAVAHGGEPAPRHTGAPAVTPGMTVDQALVLITAHLADVILHWSASAALGASPEPVHQMRVAVRRLRTALALFARELPWADFDGVQAGLKQVARHLGGARDWDVFVGDTAAQVQVAFPGDRRVAGLVGAAARQRAASYAALRAYLGSADWQDLAMRLALLPTLRPWASQGTTAEQAATLAAQAETLASHALHKAFKRLAAAGDDLAALDPDALHDVRKRIKKLRYATEFFAPLFAVKPVRRFVEKLVDLQESLGGLNDAAVAADLMRHLGGGGDRAFAAGAVQGYLACSSAGPARHCGKAWQKLLAQERFWT